MGNLRKSSYTYDFKEIFLSIIPAQTPGSENTNTIRLISQPVAFYVHWPSKKDVSQKENKLVKIPFPDADLSKRPTRICSTQITAEGPQEDPNCPWCKLGYSRQLRFMANIISRDNNKVMIIDIPSDIVKSIHGWVEGAIEEGLDNTDPAAWDLPAPDFRIKAVRQNGGSIDWTTSATNKHKKLTQEDLDLIRAINPEAKTDEEALKLYPLDLFTKPTPLLTDAEESSSNEEREETRRPVQRDTSEPSRVVDPYSDSDDFDDDEEEISPIKIQANTVDDDDDDDDW